MLWAFFYGYQLLIVWHHLRTNDIIGETFDNLSEGCETPQDGPLLNKLISIINCVLFSPHLISYSYVAIFHQTSIYEGHVPNLSSWRVVWETFLWPALMSAGRWRHRPHEPRSVWSIIICAIFSNVIAYLFMIKDPVGGARASLPVNVWLPDLWPAAVLVYCQFFLFYSI